MSSRIPAPLPSITAGLAWGTMFPIGAAALHHVDAFNLTAIRYLVASAGFLAVLALVEGRSALRPGRRAAELWALGTLGFAGFNLLVYLGLESTEPEQAAVIVSTMPLLTIVLRRVLVGVPIARATAALIVVGMAGAALVITRGDLRAGFEPGDLLVLAGVLGWVGYTLGAQRFPGWSPLRYTALSAPLGTVSIVAATVVADALGLQELPSAQDVGAAGWDLAYLAGIGGVVAVIAWNEGVRRLGPPVATLFINLVPLTAFAIRTAQGTPPVPAELAGVGLVTLALVGASTRLRRAAPAPVLAREPGY